MQCPYSPKYGQHNVYAALIEQECTECQKQLLLSSALITGRPHFQIERSQLDSKSSTWSSYRALNTAGDITTL